jgi:hypothetical protein
VLLHAQIPSDKGLIAVFRSCLAKALNNAVPTSRDKIHDSIINTMVRAKFKKISFGDIDLRSCANTLSTKP